MPNFVPGAQMRPWQASATSSPLPSHCRASPHDRPGRVLDRRQDASLTSGPSAGLPNSVMSPPAMKLRPAQEITIAATESSAEAAATASASPTRTALDRTLTGGQSMTIRAMPSTTLVETAGLLSSTIPDPQ